jgi:GT2 family glycosyltransferase
VDDEGLGYMMRPRINCNYSAVTGACLMVKRSVFEEVQGLTEEFVVGLNDVDFCLKVRSKGYLVVYDAFAKWYHYESKSRGYDDTPEKKERLQGEAALFRKYWGDVLEAGDPFYNKNFPVTIAPFTLGE